MLIDTHAHLDFVEDLDGVISRAKEDGIGSIVTIVKLPNSLNISKQNSPSKHPISIPLIFLTS